MDEIEFENIKNAKKMGEQYLKPKVSEIQDEFLKLEIRIGYFDDFIQLRKNSFMQKKAII